MTDFGELDLDLPAADLADDDLPTLATHGDLPSVSPYADAPALADANLPTPVIVELPTLATHSDLPTAFEDLLPEPRFDDLPTLATHGDLPSVSRYADAPALANADLPTPVIVELPTLATHSDLPTDLLPEPRFDDHPPGLSSPRAIDLPVPPPGAGPLDIHDEDSCEELTEGFESGVRYGSRRWARLGAAVLGLAFVSGGALSLLRLREVTPASHDDGPRVESSTITAAAAKSHPTQALGRDGLAMLQAGEAANALPLFQRASRLEPHEIEHHLHAAMAAIELERWRDAETAIANGLRLDPQHPLILHQRARLMLATNRVRDALTVLDGVVARSPRLGVAHASIATCHERLNDHPSAIDAWKKAVALDDTVADWQFRLGEALLKHHASPHDAAAHLLRAVELSSSARASWLPRAQLHLGDLFAKTDPERSRQFYEAVLKWSPDGAYADQARKALHTH